MNINIHIDINMNIDIHIIINMNIYYLLSIIYYLFPIGYSLLATLYWLFPIGYSLSKHTSCLSMCPPFSLLHFLRRRSRPLGYGPGV